MECSTAASCSLQMPDWLAFLLTVCAVAEGAAELAAGDARPPHPATAASCVSTVLGDLQRRIAVMGGREGMERSLGSVYGGSVTRFLGGFRGGAPRFIATSGVESFCNGVALSRDSSMVLMSCACSDILHIFSVHSGALLSRIGGYGAGPLQFKEPYQVWVASDGFVFVADCSSHRIQVLTPRFDFHNFIGVGALHQPTGVCANNYVIVASEAGHHCVSVFNRSDGALVRRFGRRGCDYGQLMNPAGLCFISGHRHVAVADHGNNRVSVFTLEGEFVRLVGGVRELCRPAGVACSDAGELVVADYGHRRVVVFNTAGKIVWTSEASGAGDFSGVTLHGSTIFAQTGRDGGCVVFA